MIKAILAFCPASEKYGEVSQNALNLVFFFFFFNRYLEVEWEAKRKTRREFSKSTMVDFCPRVPKQDNSSDCGVYLLQYVESFFQVLMEATFPFSQNYLNLLFLRLILL